MSNKEKCLSIIDSFSDSQLVNILSILEAAKAAINDAEDDAFCEKLYSQYENDDEKDIEYSEEDILKELSIAI